LLGLFDAPVIRLAVILVLLLASMGINFAISQRRRQHDRVLADGVVGADEISGAVDEAAALRQKLATALRLMEKSRAHRGHLYQRPWYAIVGPPGAGKTTALLNAGLRFPLVNDFGPGPVKGVGGTRYCDWWFTDDAVLIDTAGRYTSRDSDAGADRAGWEAFLDLLRITRPRQPLNGVIVAIALSDITLASADGRMVHARTIRRRVRELQTRLGLRLPIYMVFTKADLIVGFSEFFDDLNSDGRAQVWGTTFDPSADESNFVDMFTRDFRVLVERLQERLIGRLQAENSASRRALIAMFPSQVASLEPLLAEFLKGAFGGYPVHLVPRVRGVYLSSATQEGRPFDRLAGILSQAFGLDQRQATNLRPETGRSYFLQSLLRDVIFGEAMMLSDPPAVERRRTLARSAGLATAALIVVASSAWLWHLRGAGLRQVSAGVPAVATYQEIASTLPLDTVSDLGWLSDFRSNPRSLPAPGSCIGTRLNVSCCRVSYGSLKRRCAKISIALIFCMRRLEPISCWATPARSIGRWCMNG
jgi:type VI secretion system protein ImpL